MTKGIKVLIVDDDQMVLDLYKERFEHIGFVATLARDGEEAMNQVHNNRPDVILLDIMMPKINGYEFLASVKSDPKTKDIPVIILTALMRDINKSRAIEAGADDYIIKSEAMPTDVIKKIEQVILKIKKATPSADEKNPPAIPPGADPAKPAETINFEPAKSEQDQDPPPAPRASAPNPTSPSVNEQGFIAPSGSNQTPGQTNQETSPKTSTFSIICFILIIGLILASDLFFYLKLVK